MFLYRAMLPNGPLREIDRTVAAIGFLAEVRQAEDVDCTLTSRDKEDLRRRACDDEDAFAELTRRELVAA